VALFASAALAGSLLTGSATAIQGDGEGGANGVHVSGELDSLNNSGVTGGAAVHVNNRRLEVRVHARGLAKRLPHAQHIHFGAKARHECPTVFDDDNLDFRLNTVEGTPAYGPVRVSLTTRGDTSADSVLAVKRYPTAPRGRVHYYRDMRTSAKVARGIRRGNGVVVIHGVDYNHNGKYDFRSAGESELDPSLPAEATDPAACGVLHRH
jgi:hypothetical protein